MKCRSSRPELFCKKGVLRNFTKFTGKRLYHSLFFNKVVGLIKRVSSDAWGNYSSKNYSSENYAKELDSLKKDQRFVLVLFEIFLITR